MEKNKNSEDFTIEIGTSGEEAYATLAEWVKQAPTILNEIKKQWNFFRWKEVKKIKPDKKESNLLKLNCEKAHKKLKWRIVLSFKEVIKLTLDWYKLYYNKKNPKKNIYRFTISQIDYYQKKILNR